MMAPSRDHSTIFPPTPNSDLDDLVSMSKNNSPSKLTEKLKQTLGQIHDRQPAHLDLVGQHNEELQSFMARRKSSKAVHINGEDLSIASLVAVAWFNAPVCIAQDSQIQNRVQESVDFLNRYLETGKTVYGINTGYGGSADTRSNDLLSMQQGLIQHQNSGILLPTDVGKVPTDKRFTDLKSHALPRRTVRGAMLARCNSLLRGHSAVRLEAIRAIIELLNRDFIPIAPLRGSISASGDLMPLSYIAGALEGNVDIFLDCSVAEGGRQVLNASEALQMANITPMVMQPKEGLGLMNGTAISCAAAALALHETQHLALAAQALTGMCTEALGGSSGNYHPFISKARPHRGQTQVAENISRMLEGSRLVKGGHAKTAGLAQDRYALRTSPQWIGPQLEDLTLAWEQVEVELNSTTDNPLVDVEAGYVHHGGNFQAVSVTSAMEKSRSVLQMLGRLLFAQSTELVNPMLNNVLTANLCFDDPDMSFTFKGVDINMAAYASELGFLANSVSSHVQSAELHNQSLNSLALISARYTMDALEIASIMTAAYLYALCQALDLHALYLEYDELIDKQGKGAYISHFGESSQDTWPDVIDSIRTALKGSKSKTTAQRSQIAAEATILPLTKALLSGESAEGEGFKKISSWTSQVAEIVNTSIHATRARFTSEGPSTLKYLGRGSAVLYRVVRETLNLPLHRGLVEHPTYRKAERDGVKIKAEEKMTIGSRISVIYEALRSGRMNGALVEALS